MVDRAVIALGWARWRARAQKHFGASYPYVGVWEVTSSDGGHVHLHVFYHYPGFLPYREARAWWLDATADAEAGGAKMFFVKKAYGPVEARSAYLSKYLTKAQAKNIGLSISERWHKKRLFTASRGYFKGFVPSVYCCPECGQRSRLGTAADMMAALCTA